MAYSLPEEKIKVEKNFGATAFAVLRFVQACGGPEVGSVLFDEGIYE